jgi:hypothetical protein
MSDVVVVVPWRDRGDPDRLANLRHVLAYLDRIGVGPVYVSSDGRSRAATFCRSRAYNRAVDMHPRASVFIFNEADMIVPEGQLRTAVRMAALSPGLVVPFEEYRYLSPEGSHAVRSTVIDPVVVTPERTMRLGRAVGAVNVVSADTMSRVGRWDEGFSGWGYDDRAMTHAFRVCSGRNTRVVGGPGVHLWHTPGWSAGGPFAGGAVSVNGIEERATAANRRRYLRYRRASGPDEIRLLTREALSLSD